MSATPAAPSKGRIVGARTLTVLAAIIALVGSIAFYLERTVLSEDGFNEIATEMIQSPEIRNQVAAKAVEQLNANVDVEQEIANRLPEAQKALAPVLAGIVEQGAQEAANRLLERPRLQELFVRTATSTQRQVVKLLDDEGKFVRTSDGTIYLDLRPIVVEIGQQSAIASRLAERLPEDAGQIKLIDADQLDTAQTITRILRFLADWLVARRARCSPPLAVWVARGRPPDRVAGDRNRAPRGRRARVALPPPRGHVPRRQADDRRDASPAGDGRVEHPHARSRRPGLDRHRPRPAPARRRVARRADEACRPARGGSWRPSPRSRSGRTAPSPPSSSSSPTLVPVFQRGWLSFLVFLVLLVIGVEVLRRFVLAEQGATTAPTPAAPTPPPATGS